MATKLNYYEILQIPQKSTSNEIKISYYKLAKKWHPDKNNTPGAENKFKEIMNAYQVLSDESKRQLYDQQLESNNNIFYYTEDTESRF